MNVERDAYGRLRPAVFDRVFELPHPVPRCVRLPLPPPSEWGMQVHRTYAQITDTETTDFHGQRMTIVR